jgi:hypothetical protein
MTQRLRGPATGTAACRRLYSFKRPQPKLVSVAGWPCRDGRLQAILISGIGVLDRGMLRRRPGY